MPPPRGWYDNVEGIRDALRRYGFVNDTDAYWTHPDVPCGRKLRPTRFDERTCLTDRQQRLSLGRCEGCFKDKKTCYGQRTVLERRADGLFAVAFDSETTWKVGGPRPTQTTQASVNTSRAGSVLTTTPATPITPSFVPFGTVPSASALHYGPVRCPAQAPVRPEGSVGTPSQPIATDRGSGTKSGPLILDTQSQGQHPPLGTVLATGDQAQVDAEHGTGNLLVGSLKGAGSGLEVHVDPFTDQALWYQQPLFNPLGRHYDPDLVVASSSAAWGVSAQSVSANDMSSRTIFVGPDVPLELANQANALLGVGASSISAHDASHQAAAPALPMPTMTPEAAHRLYDQLERQLADVLSAQQQGAIDTIKALERERQRSESG